MSLASLAPLVALLLFAEIAAGTFYLVYIFDLLGEVSRGFLASTTVICAAFAGLALGIAATIPDPAILLQRHLNHAQYASAVHWLIASAAGLLVYAIFTGVGTNVARRVVGALTGVICALAIFQIADVVASPSSSLAAQIIGIVPATLMVGATFGGMLLGHWYLIAPDLSFRPLRQATYLIFATLILQALAITAVVIHATTAQRSTLLGGNYGLILWLLVIATGIVFTAAVTGLTLYFARMRANQPATAMLYGVIISSLMGVVPAHLIYFRTGVPI